MAKPNPKHTKNTVQMGWNPSIKGNYQAIKMTFQNEVILTKQIDFILNVLEDHMLIEKRIEEDGKPAWRCTKALPKEEVKEEKKD